MSGVRGVAVTVVATLVLAGACLGQQDRRPAGGRSAGGTSLPSGGAALPRSNPATMPKPSAAAASPATTPAGTAVPSGSSQGGLTLTGGPSISGLRGIPTIAPRGPSDVDLLQSSLEWHGIRDAQVGARIR